MPRASHAAAGLLLIIAVAPSTAVAQVPGYVRVVADDARIQRWWREPVTDVMLEVQPGTTLEVLDKENGWFWVIVPADAYGTRRAGWIRERSVEPAPAPVFPPRSERPSPSSAQRSAPPPAEDRVAISEVREGDTPTPTVSLKTYAFEDVHFDRDRYTLRKQDLASLGAVIEALKADPTLVLNLEGYTCNLGSEQYNLALGLRRANAVKEYLITQGIAAERLRTISLGEQNPKHDNADEATRQLNRRVAVVQNLKP
jgi:peptidoglycan-associated lipoprotein